MNKNTDIPKVGDMYMRRAEARYPEGRPLESWDIEVVDYVNTDDRWVISVPTASYSGGGHVITIGVYEVSEEKSVTHWELEAFMAEYEPYVEQYRLVAREPNEDEWYMTLGGKTFTIEGYHD